MPRRFIIGVDALSKEQDDQFRAYLKSKGSWWHWITNMWLFVTEDENITCADLRSNLKDMNAKARILIMEIEEDIDWAASAVPMKNGSRIGNWLKKEWAGKSS